MRPPPATLSHATPSHTLSHPALTASTGRTRPRLACLSANAHRWQIAVRVFISKYRTLLSHVILDARRYDAVTGSGIEIIERVDIPDELIPADAQVEIDAKVYAGYFAGSKEKKTFEELAYTVGRGSDFVAGSDVLADSGGASK